MNSAKLKRECKITYLLKKGLLFLLRSNYKFLTNDSCDARSRKSLTPALLHSLQYNNTSLLAKDGCWVVAGHLTAVIIQNYHIFNSNVPVTILRAIRNLQERKRRRWWREQLEKADKYLSKFKAWNGKDECEIRCSQRDVNEDLLYQGFYAVSTGRQLPKFRNSVVSPSAGLIRQWRLIRPPVNAA